MILYHICFFENGFWQKKIALKIEQSFVPPGGNTKLWRSAADCCVVGGGGGEWCANLVGLPALLVSGYVTVALHASWTKLANCTLYQLTLIKFDLPVNLLKRPDFAHFTLFHLLYRLAQSLLYPCQQSPHLVIIYTVGKVFEKAVQVYFMSIRLLL